jgi:ribose transport system permease protein
MVLGIVLIAAVIADAKWVKNRGKILGKIYVAPTYLALPNVAEETRQIMALNDSLGQAQIIGLGAVEGPEDVALDRDGNLYTGTRHGEIVRFFAPDFQRHDVFAKIGGHPLGMTFDRDDNLVTCVGGMGVYRVSPDGSVARVTDETNRSWTSIVDDSRLRLPDDLDIAPDGRIFFSEATKRYEMVEWAVDALEGRGNGRLLCHDPRTGKTRTVLKGLLFANGVTVCPDGLSLLICETWACRILRYWFDGPKKGQVEVFIDRLPGYPDNINRASDGGYWLALLGTRTGAFDLALRHPGFRRRMVRRIPADNWLFPNINRGCLIKLTAEGTLLRSYWDAAGENLPSVTSMREHRGWLYLGGVTNNRIGRIALPEADQGWTAQTAYWGAK